MDSNLKILIVDDDEGLASNLQDILEAAGYSTATAYDGESAMVLCRQNTFDLGLIDIKLPDISGITLIEHLIFITPKTEYIISTGYASLETAIEAVKHKLVVSYETKPLDIERLLSFIKQIAVRRWSEEALRESEARYRLLTENANDVIWTMDLNADLENNALSYVSPSVERIRGYTSAQVLSQKLNEILTSDSLELAQQNILEVLSKEAKGEKVDYYVLNLEHYCKDGSTVWMECSMSFLRDEKENPVGIMGVSRDISDRRKAEEEASRVQMLEELDRLRSALIASVSHELRTPLTSIKGLASTLIQPDVEWDSETQKEFLMTIDQSADRLAYIVSDLVEMAQLEAGVMRMNKDWWDMNSIINIVSNDLLTLTTEHDLEVSILTDLPKVYVDDTRIGEVLTNLVSNAAAYSDDGTRIDIEVAQKDGEIIVCVMDEGIGIPEEQLGRVFDRFFRLDKAAARRKGGSGLGLSICKGIVDNHGGSIWVESRLGKGSSFKFSLPIKEVSTIDAEDAQSEKVPSQ